MEAYQRLTVYHKLEEKARQIICMTRATRLRGSWYPQRTDFIGCCSGSADSYSDSACSADSCSDSDSDSDSDCSADSCSGSDSGCSLLYRFLPTNF
jgi:hypothetical protein